MPHRAETQGTERDRLGRLTTHVLDTAQGRPAAGLRIELTRLAPTRSPVLTTITNVDGRVAAPLLEGAGFSVGVYELLFHVGAYFDAQGLDLPTPKFLDIVPVQFGISEDAHYHVPLLIAPHGYSTYRGS